MSNYEGGPKSSPEYIVALTPSMEQSFADRLGFNLDPKKIRIETHDGKFEFSYDLLSFPAYEGPLERAWESFLDHMEVVRKIRSS